MRLARVAALAATFVTLSAAAAAQAAPPPFRAIDREYLPVPKGVMPWDASWAPDGRHILFQDYGNGGHEWIADADGGHVRCLTCGMSDHPNIIGGFTYVFPGNRRMFLSNELGDSAYVLECAPTLLRCRSHRWLPIDLSGDETPGEPNFGRRTYHLAPDGIHVGYTITRPDGLVMMVAALQRRSDKYVLTDYHVVNPPGPSGPADTNPDGWANGGSLDELKSFADGGRSVIILAEPDGVPQQEKVDLATGRVTQLTGYPDWNEDGALAPDGSALLTESWRTEQRLTALSLMPLVRPFIGLPADAIIAIYYVSSRPGFACDLQPWLLPPDGDQGGKLIGQPLNPYRGGREIPANNLEGQQVWSPDSTRVLLQGRSLDAPPAGANDYLLGKGPGPSHLIVAHIQRKPSKPVRTVTTKVGDWAPTPQTYRSTFDLPGTHVVQGKRSGTAMFTIGGNIVGGQFSAVFTNYSDDGRYFLNGTQSVTGSVLASTVITSDLTATDTSGNQVGYLKTNLTYSQIKPAPATGEPGVTFSGTVSSSWLGKTASGLPTVGACPKSMPRAPRLELVPTARVSHGIATVRARVTAEIKGDVRPVQGATVRAGSRRARTNRSGVATLRVPLRGRTNLHLVARAGDTFMAAKRGLHVG